MTTEVILLVLCCIVIALLIVFRNHSLVKKYWRYSLILAPAIVILVLKILVVIRSKKTSNQPVIKDEITNIKDKLTEVNTVVKVEAAIAKEKNDQKMEELKEVQKITDDRERRKRLAQMIG